MRFAAVPSDPKSPQPPLQDFYLWRVPGKPVSVQLPLNLVDRMEAEVMKGFWSVPKRGAEIGGILLGKRLPAGDNTIVVEDFEAVACEHLNGPSYQLSPRDRQKLEESIARWKFYPAKHVVGYFRSHTREGLMLEEEDGALISRYFSDQTNVFLLVKPSASKPPVGGIFFWEEGKIHRESSYFQFPFNRSCLVEANLAQVSEPPLEGPHAVRPMLVPVEAQPRIPANPLSGIASRLRLDAAGFRRIWFWLTAAVLLTLSILQYRTLRLIGLQTTRAAVSDSGSPALHIEQRGGYLHVNWNRNAPAIAQADRAVLSIADGGFRRELKLDRGQLRGGSVAYQPVTNEVNFRLDLMGAKTAVSESLRVLTAAPLPEPLPKPLPKARVQPDTRVADRTARPERESQVEPARASTKVRRRIYDDGL